VVEGVRAGTGEDTETGDGVSRKDGEEELDSGESASRPGD